MASPEGARPGPRAWPARHRRRRHAHVRNGRRLKIPCNGGAPETTKMRTRRVTTFAGSAAGYLHRVHHLAALQRLARLVLRIGLKQRPHLVGHAPKRSISFLAQLWLVDGQALIQLAKPIIQVTERATTPSCLRTSAPIEHGTEKHQEFLDIARDVHLDRLHAAPAIDCRQALGQGKY